MIKSEKYIKLKDNCTNKIKRIFNIYTYYEILKESFYLFWNEIDKNNTPSDFIEFKYHTNKISEIKAFLDRNNKTVFIIGEWGAGKSALSDRVVHELCLNSRYYKKKISFFGISTLDEAYSHIAPKHWKIFFSIYYFILSILIIFYNELYFKKIVGFDYSSYSTIIYFIFLIIPFIFATNKLKISYIYNCFFESIELWYDNKIKVIILDDLDRSSLKEEDRWALLSNLLRYRRKYIVPFGYSKNDNKNNAIEMIEKLNAKYFQLDIIPEILNNILHKKINNNMFPFILNETKSLPDELKFLKIFSTREIIEIIDYFEFMLYFNLNNSNSDYHSYSMLVKFNTLNDLIRRISKKIHLNEFELEENLKVLCNHLRLGDTNLKDFNNQSIIHNFWNSLINNIVKENFDHYLKFKELYFITIVYHKKCNFFGFPVEYYLFREFVLNEFYREYKIESIFSKIEYVNIYNWMMILFINKDNLKNFGVEKIIEQSNKILNLNQEILHQKSELNSSITLYEIAEAFKDFIKEIYE
nr:hypothetical protein GTC16762_33000 [Pigmentibacter ruber]